MRASKLFFPALLAAGLAGAGLGPAPAAAAVISVSVTPETVAIAATGSASVTVNWTVDRLTLDPPKPGRIYSMKLRILIDGVEAARLARPLSQDVQGLQLNETLHLHEVVQLPGSVVYRAVRQGGRLTVERRFTDSADNTFEEAALELLPSGPGSVALEVQRLALTFANGTRTEVVPQGMELRVVAEFTTTGVGLLAGVWEGAFGASAEDPLVYHPLSRVRLAVGGGGRRAITSPRLPTGFAGNGFVRFRVTDPEAAFTTPNLQYYVTASALSGDSVAEGNILLTGPEAGRPLAEDTVFSWQPLKVAARYQLRLLPGGAAVTESPTPPAGEGAPLATAELDGGTSETRLRPETLESLPAERRYLWQVIAYDVKGAVIGSSALRAIDTP